jgi:hypothetical protein
VAIKIIVLLLFIGAGVLYKPRKLGSVLAAQYGQIRTIRLTGVLAGAGGFLTLIMPQKRDK